MKNKKKIIILGGVCLVVIVISIIIELRFDFSDKTKAVNKNAFVNSSTNKTIEQQISNTENETEAETKEETTDNSSSKIELYSKNSTTVNYDELSEDEKLLYYFGFYEKIGCGNIFSAKYSEEFKMVMALHKVDKSKYNYKKCSELYSESQLKNDYYNTKYGTCGKNSDAALIPYEEANKIFKEMYGTDIKKTGFNTFSMDPLYYNFFDYSESYNSFVFLGCGACGGACGNTMSILKINSSNEINNKKYIEVYGYLGELKEVTANGNEILVLEDENHHTIELKSKDYDSAKNEVLTEKLDKLDVYEIVFNKKDGKYIFESFSKKMS